MHEQKLSTIIFPITDTHILLGKKLRGFGVGKWNGVGGKVEPHERENIPASACRELHEECGLIAGPKDLEHVAHLTFYIGGAYMFDNSVYMVHTWQGEAKDSDEMHMQWFSLSDPLPFSEMWSDDILWLPRVLAGEKLRCTFYLSEDGKQVERHNIAPL